MQIKLLIIIITTNKPTIIPLRHQTIGNIEKNFIITWIKTKSPRTFTWL